MVDTSSLPPLPPGPPGPETPTDPDLLPIPPGFENPAPHARAVRLTLTQWENSVQDLLGLDAPTGFSSELPQDALPAGFLFDNAGATLGVDPTQWEGFARAAARTAAFVVADAGRLARLLPEEAADPERSLEERGAALVAALGPRAHRRPLEAEDEAAYRQLFATGQTAYDEHLGDPFVGGVRLLLEGLLQSPHFLYRLELAPAVGDVVPLDGHAIASRLSYALWNTMPDDALFEAAAAGRLGPADEAVYQAEVRRLLEHPRATAHVQRVFDQLLEADKLDSLRPSQELFPGVPLDLGRLARAENQLFLASIYEAGGGYNDILTSSESFVNRDLARVYGLQGDFTDEMVAVQLNPTTRRGLFTHVGFLAQFATASDPDPIHRGVFLAKNIICLPLSAPPDEIPPLPPAESQETNRQLVARHTEQPGTSCAACHSTMINPLGFVYESYDAVGAVRQTDRGLPIDTSASPLFDDYLPVAVRDAVELADVMAASARVHSCLAQHLIEASLGRPAHAEDEPWITRLGAASLQGESLQDVLVELLSSPGFRVRSAVELPAVAGGQR